MACTCTHGSLPVLKCVYVCVHIRACMCVCVCRGRRKKGEWMRMYWGGGGQREVTKKEEVTHLR